MKMHVIKVKIESAMHRVAAFAAIAAATIAVLPGIARADGDSSETVQVRLEHMYRSFFTTYTTGWGSINIDKSAGNNDLKVMVDGTETTFDHGFGTHADSVIEFPIHNGYVSFSARVGVDREVGEEEGGASHGSVTFTVYGLKDGAEPTPLWTSGELTGNDDSKETGVIPVSGYTSLRLKANIGDNNAYDHADWIDPKIVMNSDGLAFGDLTVDEPRVEDCSLATSIASASVAKGVLLITAGTPILGSAEIGEHGAIAVDVSGLVTGSTSTADGKNRINLFSAASLTLPERESLSDVVVLTGPSCEYTLHSETQEGTTTVYAKITDVANAGISRKVTVWKGGNGWNNESGNWSNGAPGDESEDIGVFCDDAKLDFHNEQSYWVITYAQMLVRGATVKLFASNHSAPNITFRKITGKGRLEALGINLMPLDTLTVGADIETATGAGNTGFYPTISVGNGVTFDGPIVIGENTTINIVGYEDEVVPTGGSINLPANMKFANGVYSATATVAGHSDLTVTLAAGEGGFINASVVATIVKWTGAAENNHWSTPGNWDSGAEPTEETTVWFDESADVGLNVATAARVFVAEGAVVRFYSTDAHSWPKRSLAVKSMSGGGKVQLSNVRLVANGDDNEFTNIKVAELELLEEERWDGAGKVDYPGSILESTSTKWLRICSDISGVGGLECTKFTMHFCGDNSDYTGYASFNSGDGDNQTNRHFEKPESLFGNAKEFKFVGKMFLDFTEGTGKLGNVNFGESWGATFETKPNAAVTLEVESGSICDTWFADGFEVNGGGTLTIQKVGEGTLQYGVTKAHNLVVEAGRVEFTGENKNGDDAAVNITVRAGASIGSSRTTHHERTVIENNGPVSHRGTFTFENGAKVLQKYADGTMPVLNLTGDVNVAGVKFGLADGSATLPPATSGATPYTMLTTTGTLSGMPTTDAVYKPEGSAAGMKWAAARSGNRVILKAAPSGMMVIIY